MAFSNSPGGRGTKKAALRSALGRSLRQGIARVSARGLSIGALREQDRDQDHSGDAGDPAIENDIHPAMSNARTAGFAEKSISGDRVEEFARLALQMESASLTQEVHSLVDDGISIETIYDELITPSARWLGEMWEEDSCDFVDVTMGLWRLQEVMHEISSNASSAPERAASDAKKAIFLPMPGEQHFMGAQILEDVFTRAGWNASAMTEPRRSELLKLLSKERFDLVGLTLSRDCPSAAVRNIISAMRCASRNPLVSILVGGRMINQNPAIVAEVGADGTGADARAALDMAERLVKSPQVRAQTLR